MYTIQRAQLFPNESSQLTGFARKDVFRAVTLALILALMFTSYSALMASYPAESRIDGKFQTASTLYRLSSGDAPGKDFDSYLGTGMAFLMLPIFQLTGGTVGSATYAATFLLLVSLALLLTLVVKWIFPSTKSATLFAIVVALSALTLIGKMTETTFPVVSGVFSDLYWWVTPGASLRPLRASLPLFLVTILMIFPRFFPTRSVGLILMGTFVGVAAVSWPSDYGLPSAALFLFWLFVYRALRLDYISYKESSLVVIYSVMAFFAGGLILSAGQFTRLLSYQWRDVGPSQYWFWEPSIADNRITDVQSLLGLLLVNNRLLGVGLIALILIISRRFERKQSLAQAYLGVTFLGTGFSTSVVGYYSDEYFRPYEVWITLVVVALVAKAIILIFGKYLFVAQRSQILASELFKMVALTTAITVGSAAVLIGLSKSAVAPEEPIYAETRAWGELVRNKSLFEEYWGPLSSERPAEPVARVDSVIHARGSSNASLVDFVSEKADFVTTINPAYRDEYFFWTSWNLSANWSFYRALILNFRPIDATPELILWERVSHSAELVSTTNGVRCRVEKSEGEPFLSISSDEEGLIELIVSIETPENSRSITRIQNFLNQPGEGLVALDPNLEVQAFPVYIGSAGVTKAKIDYQTGEQIEVRSCSASKLDKGAYRDFLGLYFPRVQDPNLWQGLEPDELSKEYAREATFSNLSALRQMHSQFAPNLELSIFEDLDDDRIRVSLEKPIKKDRDRG